MFIAFYPQSIPLRQERHVTGNQSTLRSAGAHGDESVNTINIVLLRSTWRPAHQDETTFGKVSSSVSCPLKRAA